MTKSTFNIIIPLLSTILFISPSTVIAGPDLQTKFSNSGGIINTRHNLTQRAPGINNTLMDPFRNDYAQVCVYCHTPHGANTTVDLPLWNRTMTGNSYTTYDTLGTSTITSDFIQPGINSLSCLSCHDGTLGIDSVINMPGSGGYNSGVQLENNKTTVDAWLNTWTGGGSGSTHQGLSGDQTGCLVCHSTESAGAAFTQATDFRLFVIGQDLTNDHPVGVAKPTSNPDFEPTTGSRPGIQWFDSDGDNRPDSNEIRFYDTGSGPRVECASCHDPHGVPTAGFGTVIQPTFLRISNDGSQVCLTCHIK